MISENGRLSILPNDLDQNEYKDIDASSCKIRI